MSRKPIELRNKQISSMLGKKELLQCGFSPEEIQALDARVAATYLRARTVVSRAPLIHGGPLMHLANLEVALIVSAAIGTKFIEHFNRAVGRP